MGQNGYDIFLGEVRLPVTPESIKMKIDGTNKTLTLINDGEVNFLKLPSLVDISFEMLLPMRPYPFASYPDGFQQPQFYLDYLRKLKETVDEDGNVVIDIDKQTVQFIVTRSSPSGVLTWDTNIKVTLEDFEIGESYSEGEDVVVSVKLKQYKDFGIKVLDIKIPEPTAAAPTKAVAKQTKTRPTSGTTTVKPNDPAVNNVAETGKVVTGLNKFPSSDTIFTVREKDSRAYGAGSAGGEIGGTKMSGESISPWSGSGGSAAKDVQFITNLVNGAFSGLGVRFS